MDADAKWEQAKHDLKRSMTNVPNSQLVFETNVLRFAYVKIRSKRFSFLTIIVNYLFSFGSLFKTNINS